MSIKRSAGLLPFREVSGRLEVLLGHPGGPLWANRDEGIWTIPKGEIKENEDPLDAAKREFQEETGIKPAGEMIPLQARRQPSGKLVYAWALGQDMDPAELKSNTFSLEWPPKSGRYRNFPEIDRAAWFTFEEAGRKILPGQAGFLAELQEKIGGQTEPGADPAGGRTTRENDGRKGATH